MFSKVWSAAIYGVQSRLVQVEADIGEGLPGFSMVGFLSTQVREAQDRVRTALRNSGISLQPKRITVNLAPADLRKSGTGFDLPIAVAIAAAYGLVPQEALEHTLIIGELGLDGRLHGVPGVLAIAADAGEFACGKCIVPAANLREARAVGDLEVIGAETLGQILDYLKDGTLPVCMGQDRETGGKEKAREPDFSEVCGQETARRAALVAAAGFHNLLMVGPPGAGKSMIARRIPTILPDLTTEEAIELSRIYSVMGQLPEDGLLLYKRPFRAPHHTITDRALAGGGVIPKPGEISLAHKGILFLDELPEFRRETLEVLRQPLEDREMRIMRCGYSYVFPADFMLVAAMNPCPCGYYPDMRRCSCSGTAIRKYLSRISMPLLDRIDLTLEVSEPEYGQLALQLPSESSASMREKVLCARERQKWRCGEENFRFNAHLTQEDLTKWCALGKLEQTLMKRVFDEMKLTARGYHRILKTARTIADLEGSDQIREPHLQEALCYRSLSKAYW